MYHNYLVFGKIYCKHFVQRSSNNAKQTDGLARPASQSAKLQTCLPPSHVDRRGSHVQWENPPRSVSYASVHVVEQVSLPSASMYHFGQDQANNYRLCKGVRGQVGEESSPGSNTSPLSGGLEAQGVDID